MAFNLAKERLNRLREVCGELRLEDLDGLSEEKLSSLYKRITAMKKTAAHGMGDSWTEVEPGRSPYNTSPLVNSTPEFGGRWRDNFPGGGDNHINDDSNKQKSTWGNNEDFDPTLKKIKLNEKLRKALQPIEQNSYILRVHIIDKQDPKKLLNVLGEGSKYDGRSVIQHFLTFEEALHWQKMFRGSIVETNPK
jgi:hypothetical protein